MNDQAFPVGVPDTQIADDMVEAHRLPFDARERIERTLRQYEGHTVLEIAHRIMQALADRPGGSQVGDQ